MILIDLSQMLHSNMYNAEKQIDLMKHMTLNSIREINFNFHREFGEVVLCCDHGSWRKQVFPYYKQSRKEKESPYTEEEYEELFSFVDELKTIIPYKLIKVKGAEGDDVIAILTKYSQQKTPDEKVLIVSNDHDFKQLLINDKIKQYSLFKKEFIPLDDPKYKWVHILKGDSGDGIPNILSEDNHFVDKESGRQKPISKKKIEKWFSDGIEHRIEYVLSHEEYKRFKRNQMLIDFDFIPEDVSEGIINEFESTTKATKKDLRDYFIKKRMKILLESLQDF